MKCERTLICMSSLLRYFDVSISSFIDRVVKKLPHKPDFIGHFPSQSETCDNLKVIDQLSKYVNVRDIKFEDDPPKDSFNSAKFVGNINPFQRHGIVGNFFQWNSMKKCSLLKDNLEKNEGNYDVVIWSRPDLFFYNDIEDLTKLEDRFWLPGHDNHLCGLNDRFCLGNSKEMKIRLNILNYFVNEWYPHHSNDETMLFKGKNGTHKGRSPQWNPEIVFRTYVRNKWTLQTGKLSLCFGKLRASNLASAPYWFETHGVNYTGYECVEDKFNQSVFNKTKECYVESSDRSSQWGLVDVNKFNKNDQ